MISAIVLTKNEEKNIAHCLETLQWCGEVVVIDDYSTDRTVEIAEKYGARVFKRELNKDFSPQRNFGIEKAKGDWILFIDADERVSSELRDEVVEITRKPDNPTTGYFVRRRDVIWGQELKHGENGNIKLLRLAKRDAGLWKRAVHEVWDIKWDVAGGVGELKNCIMHYPHQTLSEFIFDIDRYSTFHAGELVKEGKRTSILKIMLWPKLKFFQNYILKGGFLDGTAGFVVAILMSFHSYLAWSKLWLMQNRVN